MEKIGAVREGVTVCDRCGKPSVIVVGKSALCEEHSKTLEAKEASVSATFKSFTEPLDLVLKETRTDV